MNDDDVQMILQNVARTLAFIPLERLKQYMADVDSQSSTYHALAPLLDPTGYRAQSDDNDLQNDIASHLLKAREAIEKREANVARHRRT